MAKRLRFSRIDLVERVGALMLVTFLDDAGNMYQWAPKWADVEQIYLKQINIERFNKPEGDWLNKFAKTAQSVVEGAQRIESARKVSGRLTRYEDQKLVLNNYEYMLTPGFDVTLEFLDHWLDRHFEAFLINDVAIRLRQTFQDENDEIQVVEYPPPLNDLSA